MCRCLTHVHVIGMLGKNCFIVLFGKWWQEKTQQHVSERCRIFLHWLLVDSINVESLDLETISAVLWTVEVGGWCPSECDFMSFGLEVGGRREFRDKSVRVDKQVTPDAVISRLGTSRWVLRKAPWFKYRETFSLYVLCMFMWHTPGHLLSSFLWLRKAWACTGAHTHCLVACILSLDYQNGLGLGLKQPLTWCLGSIVVFVCHLQTCTCFKKH